MMLLLDELAVQEERLRSQKELVEALKEPTTASERLVAWQGRMASHQLANLRLTRELEQMKQDKAGLERTVEEQTDRMEHLEEDMVAIQKLSDCRQLEWESRQLDLEIAVQKLEEEREVMVKAASSAEVRLPKEPSVPNLR
jgi:hypothetical protein